MANGWVFVCYCVGQIAGPQFFKSTQAPTYRSGIVAMLCAFCINFTLNQILRFIYVRHNKRREAELQGRTEEEIADMKRESELRGFEDVTDKNNVSCSLPPKLPFDPPGTNLPLAVLNASTNNSSPANVPLCLVMKNILLSSTLIWPLYL